MSLHPRTSNRMGVREDQCRTLASPLMLLMGSVLFHHCSLVRHSGEGPVPPKSEKYTVRMPRKMQETN